MDEKVFSMSIMVIIGRTHVKNKFVLVQVMDDRWEKEVTEFGAINITGFRVLDFSRKIVRDFIDVWKRDSISVGNNNTKY